MSLERIFTTSVSCPCCGTKDGVHYEELPDSRLVYTDDVDEEHTEFFGPSRDFNCTDCGAVWLILIEGGA